MPIKHTHTHTHRVGGQTDRHRDTEIGRHTETVRQTNEDRQADRNREKDRNRQRETGRQTDKYIDKKARVVCSHRDDGRDGSSHPRSMLL